MQKLKHNCELATPDLLSGTFSRCHLPDLWMLCILFIEMDLRRFEFIIRKFDSFATNPSLRFGDLGKYPKFVNNSSPGCQP